MAVHQGRGGSPSADVLDRLARGWDLTEVEKEHLFLLAQNRPPEVKQQESTDGTPQLQRVLDAFTSVPAFIRTAEWDVVAGNRAAFTLWADEVPGSKGVKTSENTALGAIAFEYSTFAVDTNPRLRLVVFNPVTADDKARVKAILDSRALS